SEDGGQLRHRRRACDKPRRIAPRAGRRLEAPRAVLDRGAGRRDAGSLADAGHAAHPRPISYSTSPVRAYPLCRNCIGAVAIAFALMLYIQPVAAAASSGSDAPAKAAAPQTKPDKSDNAGAKSDDKPLESKTDKSGDKGDDRSQIPPEAGAESKPEDPCDPDKQ